MKILSPAGCAAALVAAVLWAPLSAETRIGNIVVTPFSPGAIRPSDPIKTTFRYSTDEVGGGLVFALAFSGEQMVLGPFSGSYVYNGTGSSDFWTTLPDGYTGLIDRVLVVAFAPDLSRTFYKAWIPVEFHVGTVKAVVTGISHPSPSALLVGEQAVVSGRTQARLQPAVASAGSQPWNRWAIGMRRPMPKALLVTRRPGAAWWRFHSLRSTRRTMRRTRASSNPRATISGLERWCST